MKSNFHASGYWVLTTFVIAVACGGESDPNGGDDPGASGGDGNTPGAGGSMATAGAGGAAAAGGASTAGGSPGAGGVPPVICGGTECLQLPGAETCCFGDLCGVIDPMTSECVDPIADLRDGGAQVEPIVTDPACGMISFSLLGAVPIDLPGCCDATGVCGGNTGELPAFAGLMLPTLCLTPAEATMFSLTGPAAVPCGDGMPAGTGGASNADAATPPDAGGAPDGSVDASMPDAGAS